MKTQTLLVLVLKRIEFIAFTQGLIYCTSMPKLLYYAKNTPCSFYTLPKIHWIKLYLLAFFLTKTNIHGLHASTCVAVHAFPQTISTLVTRRLHNLFLVYARCTSSRMKNSSWMNRSDQRSIRPLFYEIFLIYHKLKKVVQCLRELVRIK